MRARHTKFSVIAAFAGFCLILSACSGQQVRSIRGDTTCDGKIEGPSPTYITAWFHTGTPAEERTLGQQVAAFNAAQHQVQVKLTDIPQAEYASQVRSAAATGNLPDVLDFDGPFLYNYAFSGVLKPLNSCVSKQLRSDLLLLPLSWSRAPTQGGCGASARSTRAWACASARRSCAGSGHGSPTGCQMPGPPASSPGSCTACARPWRPPAAGHADERCYRDKRQSERLHLRLRADRVVGRG